MDAADHDDAEITPEAACLHKSVSSTRQLTQDFSSLCVEPTQKTSNLSPTPFVANSVVESPVFDMQGAIPHNEAATIVVENRAAVVGSTMSWCVVVLLSRIRRSKNQKRLTQQPCNRPQYVYSVSTWNPLENGRMFTWWLSRHQNIALRVRTIMETQVRMNLLDSILASRTQISKSPTTDERKANENYRFNLMDIIMDRGGTMKNRCSLPKMERIELRRRELSAIVPYRNENDRRRDMLPKFWLESLWQVIFCAAQTTRQIIDAEQDKDLKRKREEYVGEHLKKNPAEDRPSKSLRSDIVVTRPSHQHDTSTSIEQSEKLSSLDVEGKEGRTLKVGRSSRSETLALNTVLKKEKARRLKAKAKEMSFLKRFGLCLEGEETFEIPSEDDDVDDDEDDDIASQRPKNDTRKGCQTKPIGPLLRIASPSSVDQKLKRKVPPKPIHSDEMCADSLPGRKKIQKLDATTEKICFTESTLEFPTGDDSDSDPCDEAHGHSSVVPKCDMPVRPKDEEDEISQYSQNSFPIPQDSDIEDDSIVQRSPQVYDDVELSERAKYLLQTLEEKRHAKVKVSEPLGTSSSNGACVELESVSNTIKVPRVTPRLSKKERKKLKKEAKKKRKQAKRDKKAPRSNKVPRSIQTAAIETDQVETDKRSSRSFREAAIETDEVETQDLDTHMISPRISAFPHVRTDKSVVPIDANGTRNTTTLCCRENNMCMTPGDIVASGMLATSKPGHIDAKVNVTKVLCSESFVEQWGELIGIIVARSHETDGHGTKQCLSFVDTDLVDDSGVDFEVHGQVAGIVVLLSSIKEAGFESLVQRVIELAALSKYRNLSIFLSTDIGVDDVCTEGLVRLQNAALAANGLPETIVFVYLVGPQTLAISVFNCLVNALRNGDVDQVHDLPLLEEHLAEPKVRERVLFLLSISPSLSVGNALALVASFWSTADADDSWFASLFDCAGSGERQIAHARISHMKAIQQISFALSVPLGVQR